MSNQLTIVSSAGRGRVLPLWIPALIVSLSLVASVHAETHHAFGLKFPVDAISPVDKSTVKVTIQGRSQLVSRDGLDEFLLRHFLSDDEDADRFSVEDLWGFLRTALRAGRSELAVVALPALVTRADDKRQREMALELDRGGEAEDLGRAMLQTPDLPPPGFLIGALILRTSLADVVWVRAHGGGAVFRYAREVKAAAQQKICESVAAKNIPAAEKVLFVLEQLYGADDKEVAALRSLSGRAKQVLEDIEAHNLDRLYTFSDEGVAGGDLQFMIPVVVDALNREARVLIAAGKPEEALGALSRVNFERRTETTHALALEAMKALSPARQSPLAYQAIELFVRKLATKDARVRDEYAKQLGQQVEYSLSSRRLGDADYYLRKLIAARPDPHIENDRLRISLAVALLEQGATTDAQDILGGIQTDISFGLRLKLIAVRLLQDSDVLIFVALALILVMALMRGRSWSAALERVLTRRRAPEQERVATDSDDEGEPLAGFAMLSQSRALSPSMQEYLKLLGLFGLDGKATVSEIKRAYRTAVKECHPDYNRQQDARASERFIELTKSYERILELRIAQGFDD